MDHINLFTIIVGVLIANAVTALFMFSFLRIAKRDEWDWYSASAMISAGVIGLFAIYNAG